MCTFYGICGDFSFLTHTQSRPDFLFRGNDFGEKEVSLLGCCFPLFTVQAPPQSNSTQQALKELGRMLDGIFPLLKPLPILRCLRREKEGRVKRDRAKEFHSNHPAVL